MFLDSAVIIGLAILSVPVYLALRWSHNESRTRFASSGDNLVLVGLIYERKERELEILRDSYRKRLDAVRNCEKLIYGHIPSSDHPEQLKSIVATPQAKQYLDSLLEYSEGVERRAEEQQAELEQHLEEKRARILAQVRRLRVVDRVLIMSAGIVRIWLIAAVLYALTSLLFGLFG